MLSVNIKRMSALLITLLFVGKQAAGIIEAKKEAIAYNITTVQEQTKVMLLPISNRCN